MNDILNYTVSNVYTGVNNVNCSLIESQIVDNLGKIPKLAFWITTAFVLIYIAHWFLKEDWRKEVRKVMLDVSIAVLWVDMFLLLPLTYHVSDALLNGLSVALAAVGIIGIIVYFKRKKKAEGT